MIRQRVRLRLVCSSCGNVDEIELTVPRLPCSAECGEEAPMRVDEVGAIEIVRESGPGPTPSIDD